jgi:F-type H+-transporting ATPase subunit b
MELNVTFLVQLSAFLVTVFLLSTLLFGPVLKVMDERGRRIEGARQDASRLQGTARQAAGVIDKRVQEARVQGQDEAGRLRLEGEKAERDLVERSRREAADQVDVAKRDVARAAEIARADLKRDAHVLAAAIADRVLGRTS